MTEGRRVSPGAAASTANSETPLATFKAQIYFRFLRVKGIGPNALTDPSGDPLMALGQTLARSEQERDTLPSVIVHPQSGCDKGLGTRITRDTRNAPIAIVLPDDDIAPR